MEATSPQAAVPQSAPSAMPTAVAPASASPSGMSQAPVSPASPAAPASMPQAPVYQQAAAPQASAPAGNPWQEAFQALSASLNTSSPSPAQVPYSAYQTPTPQVPQQASWDSTPQQQWAPSVPQISQAPASIPSLQQAVQQQAAPVSEASQSVDSYLSQISDQSLEVLEHFGAEAPYLLNQYSCAVEDALIEQVQRNQSQSLLLEAAGEERAAMNLMLTDPDVLANYVNDFYGPEGPYPTETAAETAAREQHEARAQFESEIAAQEQAQVPANFQRPEMEMPTPGRQVNAANDFWGGFGQMMDNNPENAWKYLSQAPQGALQAKMLVQDL